jgi:hypothetical protein
VLKLQQGIYYIYGRVVLTMGSFYQFQKVFHMVQQEALTIVFFMVNFYQFFTQRGFKKIQEVTLIKKLERGFAHLLKLAKFIKIKVNLRSKCNLIPIKLSQINPLT